MTSSNDSSGKHELIKEKTANLKNKYPIKYDDLELCIYKSFNYRKLYEKYERLYLKNIENLQALSRRVRSDIQIVIKLIILLIFYYLESFLKNFSFHLLFVLSAS